MNVRVYYGAKGRAGERKQKDISYDIKKKCFSLQLKNGRN